MRAEYTHRPVTRADLKVYRPAGPVRPSLGRFVGEVGVEDLWVEIPLGHGWLAAYRLLPRPGREPFVGEVRILPAERNRPGAGEWSAAFKGRRARVPRYRLTTRLLRDASPEKHRDTLRRLVANLTADTLRRGYFGVAPPATRPAPSAKPVGRPAKLRSFYATIACEYDDVEYGERDAGQSTRKRLAERHGVPESTVVGWLRTCRRLGFLTVTARGQRGARATHAALGAAGRLGR